MPTSHVSPNSTALTLASVRTHYLDILAHARAVNERVSNAAVAPERLAALAEAMATFEVTFPLIGSFNAGKSSLVNAFLGERLLKTGIVPTTAIPVEVRYACEPRAVAVGQDNRERQLTLESFRQNEFTIEDTRLIRLYLDNPRLARFADVVLVDFPGLDSGLAIHNRAIDEYLPRSVAYLVTIDAETGLTASVAQTLSEIGCHAKPIAVAITKTDKKSSADLPGILEHNRRAVRDLVGGSHFELFATAPGGDQSELDATMLGLVKRAPGLFEARFGPELRDVLLLLQGYLVTRLQAGSLVPEELDRLIREQGQHVADLVKRVDQEWLELDRQLDRATNAILGHVHAALSADVAALAAASKTPAQFDARVNAVVRQAVVLGLRQEVEPIVKNRLEHLGQQLADQVGTFYGKLGDVATAEPAGGAALGDVLKQLTEVYGRFGGAAQRPFALAFPLPGPWVVLLPVLFEKVLPAIIGVLGPLLESLFGNRPDPAAEQNRVEQHVQTTVIPAVVAQLDGPLRHAITELKGNARAGLLEQVEARRRSVVEALDGCKQERARAEADIAERAQALTHDLNLVLALQKSV